MTVRPPEQLVDLHAIDGPNDNPAAWALNDTQPTEYCDAGSHYVSVGATKPYEPGSRYRYCADCEREWIPMKAGGASEAELREASGH